MSDQSKDKLHSLEEKVTSMSLGEMSELGADELNKDIEDNEKCREWESTVKGLSSALKDGMNQMATDSDLTFDESRRKKLLSKLNRKPARKNVFSLLLSKLKILLSIEHLKSFRFGRELSGAVAGVAVLALLSGLFPWVMLNENRVGLMDGKVGKSANGRADKTFLWSDFGTPLAEPPDEATTYAYDIPADPYAETAAASNKEAKIVDINGGEEFFLNDLDIVELEESVEYAAAPTASAGSSRYYKDVNESLTVPKTKRVLGTGSSISTKAEKDSSVALGENAYGLQEYAETASEGVIHRGVETRNSWDKSDSLGAERKLANGIQSSTPFTPAPAPDPALPRRPKPAAKPMPSTAAVDIPGSVSDVSRYGKNINDSGLSVSDGYSIAQKSLEDTEFSKELRFRNINPSKSLEAANGIVDSRLNDQMIVSGAAVPTGGFDPAGEGGALGGGGFGGGIAGRGGSAQHGGIAERFKNNTITAQPRFGREGEQPDSLRSEISQQQGQLGWEENSALREERRRGQINASPSVPTLADVPVLGQLFSQNESVPTNGPANQTTSWMSRESEVAGYDNISRNSADFAELGEEVNEIPPSGMIEAEGLELNKFQRISNSSVSELELVLEDVAKEAPSGITGNRALKKKSKQLWGLEADKKSAGSSVRSKEKIEATEKSRSLTAALERSNQRIAPKSESEPLPEIETSENAFSSFSLNVNDVSYQLAQAALSQGQIPDASQIRSEEFINAFDYKDPRPDLDDAISMHYDRARHPFETNREVLRVGIQTAAQGWDQNQAMNLVILQDTSGSMERPDRIEITNSILSSISEVLTKKDRITFIGFSRLPRVWIDNAPGGNQERFLSAVEGIQPDGGTNIELALKEAYQKAKANFIDGGVNRILLLTDGAANMGNINPANLKLQVDKGRLAGISLDCFGIGWDGYDDSLLEEITRNSNGTYGFLANANSAREYFQKRWLGSVQVAAKDVKIQVEFNPQRVQRYRQVGYLKHRLTKQQFYDDKVDAAELPKAEDGQAIYVIESLPDGQGPLGWLRVRYRDPKSGQVYMKVKVLAFNGSAPSMDDASLAIRLAFASGAFAERIAGNPFGASVDLAYLQQVVQSAVPEYQNDKRPVQLLEMIRMARSLKL